MDNSYYQKYIKYKNKYLNLKMLIQTEGGYYKMERDDSSERDDLLKRDDLPERDYMSEKGDRKQDNDRIIKAAIEKTHQETYISPKEKEAAIKDKKKEEDYIHVPMNGPRLSSMSDHNPYVYKEMLFWNIQREEDRTKGTKEQIERNRSERYRKIITRINELVREHTNITVIGLQECHKSLQIDGFFRINFAPKASTIMEDRVENKAWEKIDNYGNSLFIKGDSIDPTSIPSGNHNYITNLRNSNSDNISAILGRPPTEQDLSFGERVKNYFNYVFIGEANTLYVNIHGDPDDYYHLNDLFKIILDIKTHEMERLQNIYIGGDFNKTSDMLSKQVLSRHVPNFSQLIKYFNYNGVMHSESTRKRRIIDHIIKFTLKPIEEAIPIEEATVLNHNKETGKCTILFNSGKWAYAQCDKATLEQTIPDETKYQKVLDQSNKSLPGTYLKYQTRVTVRHDEGNNYTILSVP